MAGIFRRAKRRTRKEALRRTRRGSKPRRFEALEDRRLMAVFTVNSIDDFGDADPGDGVADTMLTSTRPASGITTLRAAIEEANALPGKDVITFDLPTGQETITVPLPLPDIIDPVTIDGAPLVRTGHGRSKSKEKMYLPQVLLYWQATRKSAT